MIRICKTSWVHWENIRYTLKPKSQFNAQNPSARFCSDRTIQKENLCSWFFNSGYIQNIQQSYSRHIYMYISVCVYNCWVQFFWKPVHVQKLSRLAGERVYISVVCLFEFTQKFSQFQFLNNFRITREWPSFSLLKKNQSQLFLKTLKKVWWFLWNNLHWTGSFYGRSFDFRFFKILRTRVIYKN